MQRTLALAQQIGLWADKLRDMAAMGMRYSPGIYDRENYAAIRQMALEMTALAGGELPETLEPLRDTVFSRPTPNAVGDGAVIDEQGRILLIRRSDNKMWAMPGGALSVGETPAEGVLREILEETGWRCKALDLIGVFDSRLCGTVSRFHLYHFQFLCQPIRQETDQPEFGFESLETGWFAEADLPPDQDPGHIKRISLAFRFWEGKAASYFDRPGNNGL